ncbi:MAG: MaoC/PaaZ C-terminal domain-containing protein [Solirubrobacteraceae bacterium]
MRLTVDERSQRAFADLSGDHNPLHVDAMEARLSHLGAPVVHGLHSVMLVLDRALALADGPRQLTRLTARFRSGFTVGTPIDVDVETAPDGTWAGTVRSSSGAGAEVSFELAAAEPAGAPPAGAAAPFEATVQDRRAIGELATLHGSEPLAVDPDALAQAFPSVAAGLAPGDAAALLALTRVVGMRCPGRWALLRSVHFARADAEQREPGVVRWRVARVREALRLVELEFEGPGWDAGAQVVLRDPPVRQVSRERAAELVGAGEFAGVRVVVVGGSRGLGEAATRLLLAGGATCLVTYRLGREDAERAIDGAADGQAAVLAYDAAAPDPQALRRIEDFAPTAVAYFATPPIPRRLGVPWDQALYSSLEAVYVDGFARLCEVLRDSPLRTVLYPSTAYLDEPAPGFDEYVAAKTAGEALAGAIADRPGGPAVHVERLSAVATDQTAGGPALPDPADVLLPLLRELFR